MTQDRSPAELLLSPYRVLDFTDQGGLLCGKILADLGADVIQVEPPGGSSARKTGPFYNDDVHPEKSLFWWALAANKRGITLNLETLDGRDLFRSLVQDAHFVIESFPPGYLVLQLQKCGEEFQAASVMAAPGRCLVPPSPPGPPQH